MLTFGYTLCTCMNRYTVLTLSGKAYMLYLYPFVDGLGYSVRGVFLSTYRTPQYCDDVASVVGLSIVFQAQSDLFFANTGRWITAYYSMTLAANLSASCTCAFQYPCSPFAQTFCNL